MGESNFPIISENLNFNSSTIKNGGQKVAAAQWNNAYANVRVPLTGKWYWEYITDNYVYSWGGIARPNYGGSNQHTVDFSFVQAGEYRYNGVNQANTSSIGTGDIVGVYVNDGVIKVYVNNSLDHTYSQNLSIIGSDELYPCFTGPSNATVNFGQDSSFLGVKTAQGNTDANGVGDFYYTPPDGALALCSANTPISSDIDPAQTNSDFPQKQFNVTTYTGNGTSQSITGLGFKPDFCWIKKTNSSQSHVLMDSSRGTSEAVESNTTSTDTNFTQGVTAFGTDGFSVGNHTQVNNSTDSYIAWSWKANGGTTTTNTSGTITSTVQANTKAGFSIITFQSPNSSSDQTVGHGLSSAPDFIMSKNRSTSYNWDIFHSGFDDTTKGLRLNTNDGLLTGRWGSVSSTVITTKNSYTHNGTDNYVFYAWHSVAGYSKFGTFTANGTNNNGPFIDCGFRPAMILFKGVVSGAAWVLKDDTLDGYNPGAGVMQPGSSAGKYTTAGGVCNILANGFKITTDNAVANSTSYDPYIYMAWASVPFKYGNTL